jgi:hypothetical protein
MPPNPPCCRLFGVSCPIERASLIAFVIGAGVGLALAVVAFVLLVGSAAA